MDTGVSLYNVGTSLDLEALTRAGSAQNNSHEDEESDDNDEEENRNAELQNLLTNAFDDLIDEDEVPNEMENTGDDSHFLQPSKNLEATSHSPNYLAAKQQDYIGDSLYSPINLPGDLSETQYHDSATSTTSPRNSVSQHQHKKHCVRFSGQEDTDSESYNHQKWRSSPGYNYNNKEQQYLSSGLNSQAELEILYDARGTEIQKLSAELHKLQHKVALLEGEKSGLKTTLETSERVLIENREENRRLNERNVSLNHELDKYRKINDDLSSKLMAAESNIVNLERQILDQNLLQANHRDANRQEVLLKGIKVRYENDLCTLRDELSRLRNELETKNGSIVHLERKLRDMTEMHERTLTERAANLQEFNRALDQQRVLREQRDALTSATLLDQLSKAQEEIERLKVERVSQNLSDSMTQMRLSTNINDHRDNKQTERIITSLEQRLKASEKKGQQLEEMVRILQKEKEAVASKLVSISNDTNAESCGSNDRLLKELNNVKELYLIICGEKDSLEEQLQKLRSENYTLEDDRKQLLKELEEVNRHMEENLNRHKAMVEANCDAKMQTSIQEHVARARLEWLKEKTNGQMDDLVHVEKSIGELQCLRETMDALRNERDVLQQELMRQKQQLKLERHLLGEKFAIEKEVLIKTWKEKVASASVVAAHQSGSHLQDKSLVTATADAMARLRQQCEEEKLSIIASYEKQVLELQSTSSTPQLSTISSSQPAQPADWKLELSKVKMSMKGQSVPADLFLSLDCAIQKMEARWRRDQKSLEEQTEKYKKLKRRVRDYQKYVNDKLAKYKSDRERSEDYCRRVISDLLGKVTHELQQLERDRRNGNDFPTTMVHQTHPNPVVRGNDGLVLAPQLEPASTFAQSIDDLQQQVNRYVLGLTNFSTGNL